MKRLRLLALFVAVTTAPALTGTVHAGPVATEYPTDLGSSVDLSSPNDAASFRRDVGLRSDDGWVSRVAASADASLTWGVPLTPDESQELDRRFDIQQHQADVAKYLEDNPAFAGHVDRPEGPRRGRDLMDRGRHGYPRVRGREAPSGIRHGPVRGSGLHGPRTGSGPSAGRVVLAVGLGRDDGDHIARGRRSGQPNGHRD